MRLGDFEGAWHVDRRIDDRLLGRAGRFTGTATFTPDADGLVYHEAGTLTVPGTTPLSAEQSYLWRADGQGIAVSFADGRPFHRIALAAAICDTSHDCPPDLYHVRYDFTGWPGWTAIWQVSGPRKDYTSTTLYRRT